MLRRRVLPSAGGLQRFLAGSLSVIKPAAILSDEWEQYIPDSFGQRANIGIVSSSLLSIKISYVKERTRLDCFKLTRVLLLNINISSSI